MENFDIDLEQEQEVKVEIPKNTKRGNPNFGKKVEPTTKKPLDLVNPLKNERVVVRFVPSFKNGITDRRHLMYGGMMDGAKRTFVVPRRSDGLFVNVLTNEEKEFLEDAMGLEPNAMSIYKKTDNFWDDSNPNGINTVTLEKGDNYLNLASPEDYIKYKILLANTEFICKSQQELQDRPKESYQFVIISEQSSLAYNELNMTTTMQCYKEFGKIEQDKDKLALIIEQMTGRPYSTTGVNIVTLQTKVNECLQGNPKLFLSIVTDSHLQAQVVIKKGLETGVIVTRNELLYHKVSDIPLCNDGERATKKIAAKFIDDPKNQELRLTIEAEIKEKEKEK